MSFKARAEKFNPIEIVVERMGDEYQDYRIVDISKLKPFLENFNAEGFTFGKSEGEPVRWQKACRSISYLLQTCPRRETPV